MPNHSIYTGKRVDFPILSLLLLTVSCQPVNPPAIAWSKTFTGDGYAEGRSVQPTKDGGFIVGGATYRNSDGRQRIYLVRTDGNGDTVWTRTFANPDTSDGHMASYGTAWPTDDGGFVVAGAVSWSDDGNNYFAAVYVLRTDANGDTLWTRRYSQRTLPYVASVQQTADGGFIVSFGNGEYESSAFLLRLDSLGDSLWLKSYGHGYWGTTVAARQTTDGGFILATTLAADPMETHAHLVKTDANGDSVWSYTSTAPGQTSANDVQQTSDGGYVTAGRQQNTVGFWTNIHDMYLMKVSANGQLQWERNFGPQSMQEAQAVQQISDGGYLVGGWTSSTYSVNVPCVVKTDAKGNAVWSDRLGMGLGQVNSVCEAANGGYVLTGQVEGSTSPAALLAELNPAAQ